MQDPAPLLVEIPINSAIVSGFVAVVFDIFILLLIKTRAQSICEHSIVRLIFDKRLAVSPKASRLGLIFGGPTGPPGISRILSLALAVCTICVVVLGFSVVGSTVTRYERLKYTSVLSVGDRPLNIDFERESRNFGNTRERKFSRRMIAVSMMQLCTEKNYTHTSLYGFAYKDVELDYSLMLRREGLEGAECMTESNFRQAVAHISYDREPKKRCAFSSITTTNESATPSAARFKTTTCDVQLTHMYCILLGRILSCTGVGTRLEEGKNRIYGVSVPHVKDLSITQVEPVPDVVEGSDMAQYAANMAFFQGHGFAGGIAAFGPMGVAKFEKDLWLEKSNGTREVSNVNFRIVIPILAIIGMVLGLLLLADGLLWLLVVRRKGRQPFNNFCSVSEVVKLVGELDIRNGYKNCAKSWVVGIRGESPCVGIMEKKEYNEGTIWDESDLR